MDITVILKWSLKLLEGGMCRELAYYPKSEVVRETRSVKLQTYSDNPFAIAILTKVTIKYRNTLIILLLGECHTRL